MSKGLGFNLDPPKYFPISNNQTASYVKMLREVTAMRVQMVMVVIPNKSASATYNAIKIHCNVEVPTVSQVVTATVLKKPKGLASVATKVAVQMAAKLGGEPWAVPIPLKQCLVIGYDSYHDTTGPNKCHMNTSRYMKHFLTATLLIKDLLVRW